MIKILNKPVFDNMTTEGSFGHRHLEVILVCGHIGVDYSGIWCTFFEGTRILEINHYDFFIPGHIGHYSKRSYRCV